MTHITTSKVIKKLTVINYSDAGHSWFKVSRKIVEALPNDIHNKISIYSYQRGDNVYLEEDCDGPLVLEALRVIGVQLKVKYLVSNGSRHRESRIRGYERYKANSF